MTAYQIKIIAILAMIIDHIGVFFFPDIIAFRIIGRLAFILFAWLIANGAYYTKNINKYLIRLLIFAVLAQIPYTLALQQAGFTPGPNVLFTLFLGLLAIKFIRENNNLWGKAITAAVCVILANSFNTEYGTVGVLSVVASYIFFKDIALLALSQVGIFVFQMLINIKNFYLVHNVYPANFRFYIQLFCLFAIFIIAGYNNQPGKKAKYLFYIFYPAQFVVVLLINYLL